jgi:polyphosphate kinase
MGFCTNEQHERFLEVCPSVGKYIVDTGIQPIKFWLEVGNEEQKRRFEARIEVGASTKGGYHGRNKR